ncbi:sigma-70 family RNA polymerase sigma factor [Fodinicola feengrottensis]|uniref:RNA polymerase sigma factor n=1 Tax=Fodinicola feengrottensis TaxID=435914 RepID=A0ABN2FUK4_9ACTN
MSDNEEFVRLADPFRRELLAHCYRMLGSVHEAEDLVQETYIRAWRAYDNFEGRSSLRTWLYRIATRTCLTELDTRKRRPLPADLGAASDNPTGELASSEEVSWLQPMPDAMVETPADPAAVVASRDSIRLALIAALQHLPPKQRAVLILRDVLAWRAAEVAELLETSTAAVNSALQRARAQLEEVSPAQDSITEPDNPQDKALLKEWVSAFERYDTVAIKELLTQDATWQMPPYLSWFSGREAIVSLIETHCPAHGAGAIKIIPTQANGQTALALYILDDEGVHRAHSLQVPTIVDGLVAKMVAFFDTDLFARFGLPDVHPDSAALPVSAAPR